MVEIEKAIATARHATDGMAKEREEADKAALEAVEQIEKSLVEALAGEGLRGLPDLGDRVYGLRVGTDGSAHAKIPPDGRVVPVLDRRGVLVVASLHGRSAFVQRAPRGLIRASLLVPYIRAVLAAIGLHVQSASERSREFSGLAALAEKITEALEDFSSRHP